MTDNLQFDLTVDKSMKMVYNTREFDAEQSLVWDAFTKAELLDQWLPPRPLTAKTKYQDFRVGGKRFYAMIMPDGQERWALQTYTSITPITNFKMFNTFADKDENPDPHGSDWDHTFSEENGKTTVHISIYNESLERMEAILEGFTQGMKMSLSNLEELLAHLKEQRS
jgi:uncharacterized protein YndB with AHSA1/START domain